MDELFKSHESADVAVNSNEWVLFVHAQVVQSMQAKQYAPSFVQIIDVSQSDKPPWLKGVPTLYYRPQSENGNVTAYEGSAAIDVLNQLRVQHYSTSNSSYTKPANVGASLGFPFAGESQRSTVRFREGKLTEKERDDYMKRRNRPPVHPANVKATPSYLNDGSLVTM